MKDGIVAVLVFGTAASLFATVEGAIHATPFVTSCGVLLGFAWGYVWGRWWVQRKHSRRQSDVRFEPNYVVAPAAVLQEWLDDHHRKPEDWPAVANDLRTVLNRQPMSPSNALGLAAVTDTTVAFWIEMERLYREGLAQGKVET